MIETARSCAGARPTGAGADVHVERAVAQPTRARQLLAR